MVRLETTFTNPAVWSPDLIGIRTMDFMPRALVQLFVDQRHGLDPVLAGFEYHPGLRVLNFAGLEI